MILIVVTIVIFVSSCELTRPISATSNPIGSKVGQSSAASFLFFPPFIRSGDASIQTAAKNGGITKISTVDYTWNWYIIFNKWTCTVTGE